MGKFVAGLNPSVGLRRKYALSSDGLSQKALATGSLDFVFLLRE
jgi:hypothetical protein